MTTDELIEYVADALNLTNADQKARVGRELNVRYRQVTSSIGLIPARREELSKAATIGSQYVTFTGTEKLDTVYRKITTKKRMILIERTNDEMVDEDLHSEPPTHFAVFSIGPQTITIVMNCIPTTAFTLYAMGAGDVTTLTGTVTPNFSESYHDILIHGVMADEYRRKEKVQLAMEAEKRFEERLSDLRMFIAKSAYLDIYDGKHSASEGWWDTNRK